MTHRTQAIAALLAVSLAVVPLAGCGTILERFFAPRERTEQSQDEQGQATVDYLVLVNERHELPQGWEDAIDLVKVKGLLYDDTILVERKAYQAF